MGGVEGHEDLGLTPVREAMLGEPTDMSIFKSFLLSQLGSQKRVFQSSIQSCQFLQLLKFLWCKWNYFSDFSHNWLRNKFVWVC